MSLRRFFVRNQSQIEKDPHEDFRKEDIIVRFSRKIADRIIKLISPLEFITPNHVMIAELCKKNNLAGIIRQPIQSGILSGKYTKDTKRDSNHFYAGVDFTTERYKEIFESVEALKDLLIQHDLTMVQASLGYIWAKNKRVIPIPGAKTIEQISENAKTLEYGPISRKLMSDIDSLFKNLQVDFSYETFPYYKNK